MNGVINPYKIPLPNTTRWNSWFRMVFYLKTYIEYWPEYFLQESTADPTHENLLEINSWLQNKEIFGTIKIFINFISIFAKEFVQDLDFFQQQNQAIFPFVEGRLEQLTAYIETNRHAQHFGSNLEDYIINQRFNPLDFYPIFRDAFQVAYKKFSNHIPHHPARNIFQACRVFDPAYLHANDILRKDIRRYAAIKEFENPSDDLIREWSIYCNLPTDNRLKEAGLNEFWLDLSSQLPILSNIALNYIWLPISSCSVERSFSLYNTILDDNRQNLSEESLKFLTMMYFNGN